MYSFSIFRAMEILEKEYPKWREPVVTGISKRRDPFKVLISCILSLRTKDETTRGATERLFSLANNPYDMINFSEEKIAKAIYPVGFFRNKARTVREVCCILIERYDGKVPQELGELLRLPGVGRKTANLVLTKGYGKPGICVDIHVHRICNRWGYVSAKSPHETEMELREKLPKGYWLRINDLLVAFGQNICRPISPLCTQCPLEDMCPRIGVTRHR